MAHTHSQAVMKLLNYVERSSSCVELDWSSYVTAGITVTQYPLASSRWEAREAWTLSEEIVALVKLWSANPRVDLW